METTRLAPADPATRGGRRVDAHGGVGGTQRCRWFARKKSPR